MLKIIIPLAFFYITHSIAFSQDLEENCPQATPYKSYGHTSPNILKKTVSKIIKAPCEKLDPTKVELFKEISKLFNVLTSNTPAAFDLTLDLNKNDLKVISCDAAKIECPQIKITEPEKMLQFLLENFDFLIQRLEKVRNGSILETVQNILIELKSYMYFINIIRQKTNIPLDIDKKIEQITQLLMQPTIQQVGIKKKMVQAVKNIDQKQMNLSLDKRGLNDTKLTNNSDGKLLSVEKERNDGAWEQAEYSQGKSEKKADFVNISSANEIFISNFNLRHLDFFDLSIVARKNDFFDTQTIHPNTESLANIINSGKADWNMLDPLTSQKFVLMAILFRLSDAHAGNILTRKVGNHYKIISIDHGRSLSSNKIDSPNAAIRFTSFMFFPSLNEEMFPQIKDFIHNINIDKEIQQMQSDLLLLDPYKNMRPDHPLITGKLKTFHINLILLKIGVDLNLTLETLLCFVMPTIDRHSLLGKNVDNINFTQNNITKVLTYILTKSKETRDEIEKKRTILKNPVMIKKFQDNKL